MCQFSSFICDRITAGWYIPVAANAAPKTAPETKESIIEIVVMGYLAPLLSSYLPGFFFLCCLLGRNYNQCIIVFLREHQKKIVFLPPSPSWPDLLYTSLVRVSPLTQRL